MVHCMHVIHVLSSITVALDWWIIISLSFYSAPPQFEHWHSWVLSKVQRKYKFENRNTASFVCKLASTSCQKHVNTQELLTSRSFIGFWKKLFKIFESRVMVQNHNSWLKYFESFFQGKRPIKVSVRHFARQNYVTKFRMFRKKIFWVNIQTQ